VNDGVTGQSQGLSRSEELCIEGTQAEFDQRFDEARRLYRLAWDVVASDRDRCIAAHYVARLEEDVASAHAWNVEALQCAERVPQDRVEHFLPSLYVNLGRTSELRGQLVEAADWYDRAREHGLDHSALVRPHPPYRNRTP
jgi:hypothetical protein